MKNMFKRALLQKIRGIKMAACAVLLSLAAFALAFSILTGAVTAADDAASAAGDVYEVYLQYTCINTEQTGIRDVENAINAISEPAIGVRVHIVPVFIGNLAADTAYAIAGGEKIDIVNVGLTNSMSSLVSEGLLLPLDTLLMERGQDALKVTERVAQAQKINGITYAISQYPYAANSSGFYYNQDMADRLGLAMHDGISLEELGEMGPRLKEEGVSLTSVGLSSSLGFKFFRNIETFGEAGNYGVIFNPAESTAIENLYATEEFREYYRTIRSWYEAGYMPENQMLEESQILGLFGTQDMFGMPTNVTAGQLGNGSVQSFHVGVVKTSDPLISTSGVVEFMLGIASTCQNPEKAMDFINLIYADPQVANLLNYGVEGLDYVHMEGTEHVITTTGTENADGSRYGSGFIRFGDPLAVEIKYPLTDTYYDELMQWEEEAEISKTFGYSFDVSEYSVEAGKIKRILDEYLPILNVGFVQDVDAQIDAMNRELEEAGIDRIIAANQAQLDAFLVSR